MAADVDVRVIKKTQDTLGTIIKKPPLNEKLLKKPPFRFLHDIITNVITNTGFMDGLYNEEDLVSENVKEKDNKILFLQKAIDVVSMVTGQNLTARPSKIVAGQEPTKTNEFLQALAKALIQKQNSSDAVQKVLNGEKPSVPEKKVKTVINRTKDSSVEKKAKPLPGKPTKPTDKPTKEPQSKTSKEATKKTPTKKPIKDDLKPTKTHKTELKPKKDPKSVPKEEAPVTVPVVREPEIPSPKPSPSHGFSEPLEMPPPPTPKPEPSISPPAAVTPKPMLLNPETPEKEKRPVPSARPAAPSRQSRQRSSHHSSGKVKEKIEAPDSASVLPKSEEKPDASFSSDPIPRPQSAMRARSARPTTARPAPPRIINRNIVNAEDTARTPSAKPVTNLILDTEDTKDDEEDEGFVVEDKAVTESEDLLTVSNDSGIVSVAGPSGEGSVAREAEEDSTAVGQQGSLVRQMLETKKGLEGGSLDNRKNEGDLSQEANNGGKQQQAQALTSSKELEQLRQFIQTVSRSANPLGKMLDYLQEDIDSMNAELRTWREEHHNNLVALRREEGVTDTLLDPLSKQLEELEQAVQDQGDQIGALKATILHNDKRIYHMLTSAPKA